MTDYTSSYVVAGRVLDGLVAEHVTGSPRPAPFYSSKPDVALGLLRELFAPPKHCSRLVLTETRNWRCDIELYGGDGPVVSAAAKTLSLAICLAALEARGIDPLHIEKHFVPF